MADGRRQELPGDAVAPRLDGVIPATVTTVPRRPDELLQFRLGRLLILLEVVPSLPNAKTLHLERLGFYDFFADNPFLIFDGEAPERRALLLAGFTERNLSYQSAAQRFANRRSRLQHDLAVLVSRRLVAISTKSRHVSFTPTDEGLEAAGSLGSFYAHGYRSSAEIIVRRLNRLSDAALTRDAERWLRAEAMMVEIFDEVQAR